MASEIKVDTISEKTSANGVTIDSLSIKDGGLVAEGNIDVNGNNLVLDANANTYLDAGTDDTIKVYVSGAEDLRIAANAINVLSGTTLTIDSGATIANSGTATGFSSADPASADGDTLGTASAEWSDLYLADSSVIYFGNDQEITLTHSADSGLLLKHTATADDKPINLVLQTGETDMAANDVIGKISWQAPDEGTGTDAILVSAAIQAVAEGDHSSSSNATSLQFMTGASEAAATKMTLTSAGKLEVSGGADIEGAVVFNEDSADVDFRVESNSYTHMLTVDGGANVVGVSTGGFMGDLGAGIHIKTADSGAGAGANADELVIENSAHAGISILSGATSGGNIYFADSGDNDIGAISYDHNTNAMLFTINASERMRIHSNGSMGVMNANTTNVPLKVAKDNDGEWMLNVDNTSSGNPNCVILNTSGATKDDNSNRFLEAQDATAVRFMLMTDGDCRNHDNSYGAISDERIKQDIRDANSQWDDIKALKVRNFKRKDDVRQYKEEAKEQIGLVAQEAELVSPKLVNEIQPSIGDILSDASFGTLVDDTDNPIKDGDGNITGYKQKIGVVNSTVKTMEYSILYMKAIKALQEAQTRIETLEAKVAVLEG